MEVQYIHDMSNDENRRQQNRMMAVAKRERLLENVMAFVPGEDGESGADDVLEVATTVTASVLLEYGGPTTRLDFHFSDTGDLRNAELSTSDNPDGEYVTIDLSLEEAETLADHYVFGIDSLADVAMTELHANWPGAYSAAFGGY